MIEFNIEDLKSIDGLYKYRKGNLIKGYKLIYSNNNKLDEIIDVRFYETKTYIYCCVWISDDINNVYIHGAGKAGGYGYHMGSASFSYALTSMGIKNNNIHSVGDNAIKDGLFEIGEKLGYNKEFLHIIEFTY